MAHTEDGVADRYVIDCDADDEPVTRLTDSRSRSGEDFRIDIRLNEKVSLAPAGPYASVGR